MLTLAVVHGGTTSASSEASTSSTAEAATIATTHHANHRLEHGHWIASAKAATSWNTLAADILSLRHHCQLSTLEQGLTQVLCSDGALFVDELNVRLSTNYKSEYMVIYLPEWLLSLEVLPDMDGGDLAAAVEMLSERGIICTVVNILDEDTSLITVITICRGFGRIDFVLDFGARTFLAISKGFLVYRYQFDVLGNIRLKMWEMRSEEEIIHQLVGEVNQIVTYSLQARLGVSASHSRALLDRGVRLLLNGLPFRL